MEKKKSNFYFPGLIAAIQCEILKYPERGGSISIPPLEDDQLALPDKHWIYVCLETFTDIQWPRSRFIDEIPEQMFLDAYPYIVQFISDCETINSQFLCKLVSRNFELTGECEELGMILNKCQNVFNISFLLVSIFKGSPHIGVKLAAEQGYPPDYVFYDVDLDEQGDTDGESCSRPSLMASTYSYICVAD